MMKQTFLFFVLLVVVVYFITLYGENVPFISYDTKTHRTYERLPAKSFCIEGRTYSLLSTDDFIVIPIVYGSSIAKCNNDSSKALKLMNFKMICKDDYLTYQMSFKSWNAEFLKRDGLQNPLRCTDQESIG